MHEADNAETSLNARIRQYRVQNFRIAAISIRPMLLLWGRYSQPVMTRPMLEHKNIVDFVIRYTAFKNLTLAAFGS